MISAQLYNRYATDPAAFRSDLTVDVDGIARRFGDVMDPWQRADFAALDPALMRCNGRSSTSGASAPSASASDTPPKMRAYLERARGHSKTSDLAVLAVWALAFATRPIRGYAFAADQDQASLLKDAMARVIRLNPWLSAILEVQRLSCVNIAKGHPGEGGKLEIFTSDVASSYGILPDIVIADELCHWEGDGSLWHSIISSVAKRATCLLTVITNAGFADSWQWQVREAARMDEAWHFSRLDGPVASWISASRLAEQKRMLPLIAFQRLWMNEWSSCGGDALTPADIAAAFRDDQEQMSGKEPGWLFVAGLDLGLTRDCSAVVVLAVRDDGRSGHIRLAYNRLWRPTPGKKIELPEVEKHILELDDQYNLRFVGFDPWQAEHMAQRLEALSEHRRRLTDIYRPRRLPGTQPWMRSIQPTAANLRAQATLTIECFQDHRLQLDPCEPLHRDLLKLRVEEKSYGIRLVSPRDGEGHGDTFSAFVLALLIGHELAGKRPVVCGPMFSSADSGRYQTSAYERALNASAGYAAQLERESRELAAAHANHNYEIQLAMARVGRANYPHRP
jgi:phage terminase large subunit-like protein